MQETRVWSLVQEDSTCCKATKPKHHNYWAYALEPGSRNYQSPLAPELVLHIRWEVTAMRSLRTATGEQFHFITTWEKPKQRQRLSTIKKKKKKENQLCSVMCSEVFDYRELIILSHKHPSQASGANGCHCAYILENGERK